MNDLTPFDDDPPYQELIEKVDAHIDTFLVRWDAAVQPLMEGARELTTTVITVSAGALVLSLSVAQLLQDRLTETPVWGWLLPVAWLLLVVAIIAGVFRQGGVVGVVSHRARVEAKRSEVLSKVRKVDLDGDVDDQLYDLLAELKGIDESLQGNDLFRRLRLHHGLVIRTCPCEPGCLHPPEHAVLGDRCL